MTTMKRTMPSHWRRSNRPKRRRPDIRIGRPIGATALSGPITSTDLGLQISQNLSLTGGNFFVQTSSQRMDELGTGATAYSTQPISIGYSQSLFGYNYLKWDKRIEPVRFREAGKAYAETLELIASKTCELFYSLATAQTNLNIAAAAASNYASADTLYRYARGRYNIGNITENEMLQLEVNKLNEETNLMQARIEVEDLRTVFLRSRFRWMKRSDRHTPTAPTWICISDSAWRVVVNWLRPGLPGD